MVETYPQTAVDASRSRKDCRDRKPFGSSICLSWPYKCLYCVAKAFAFSARLASMRCCWEGRIHVDGSMNGAYIAISGITSSRIRAMIRKGTTL